MLGARTFTPSPEAYQQIVAILALLALKEVLCTLVGKKIRKRLLAPGRCLSSLKWDDEQEASSTLSQKAAAL